MFIKFTHYGNATIFNINQIISIRLDVDAKTSESKTKVFVASGAHVFIDESVKEAHKMLNEVIERKVAVSYDYEVPSIPTRMEEQFNRDYSSPRVMEFQRPKRVRQYSARPNYNSNGYQDHSDRW